MNCGNALSSHKSVLSRNNFYKLYPNPTSTDIPDFDSEDFMDTEGQTNIYCAFYSYCICEKGEQRIQYIDNYSMCNTCVTIKKLAELFPDMTVLDLLDWIEYCKVLSKEVLKNDD